MHISTIVLSISSVVLIGSVTGILLGSVLYYRGNTKHFHSAICEVPSCSTSARYCGSGCGRSSCFITICIDAAMHLRAPAARPVSLRTIERNITYTYAAYVTDTTLLHEPPNCSDVVYGYNSVSHSIRCHYDDRRANQTLRLTRLSAPGGSIAVIVVCSIMAFYALIFVAFSAMYFLGHCGDAHSSADSGGGAAVSAPQIQAPVTEMVVL